MIRRDQTRILTLPCFSSRRSFINVTNYFVEENWIFFALSADLRTFRSYPRQNLPETCVWKIIGTS